MWVNYPHMPTGAAPTDDLFKKLIEFGREHNILIVNDNPYSFILNNDPKSILSYNGAKDVAIELNSLSKTFNMSGWRVGMVLGNASYINNILKVKSNMDSGMFYGIQQGAIAALKSDINWFKNLNAIYEKRRKIAWKIADTLNCTYDINTAGLFVWAKLPKSKIATEVADELLYKYNVFLAPGTIFGSNGKGYIRISLCVSEDLLQEVLNRISKN
jgi:aspartate/methionine/tyrosine aminotransferase